MANETNKDYTLIFEQKEKYLYVFASGPRDSLVDGEKVWKKIQKKITELSYDKLLIEEDFPNQLSPVEMFETGKLISKLFPGNKKSQ